MNNLSKPRINYTKPSITRLEVEYATDAAKNGWGNNCYDYINKFDIEALNLPDIEILNAIKSS